MICTKWLVIFRAYGSERGLTGGEGGGGGGDGEVDVIPGPRVVRVSSVYQQFASRNQLVEELAGVSIHASSSLPVTLVARAGIEGAERNLMDHRGATPVCGLPDRGSRGLLTASRAGTIDGAMSAKNEPRHQQTRVPDSCPNVVPAVPVIDADI